MIKVKDTYKDIFLKTLSRGLFGKFDGKVTKENTTIINDSTVKHLLNDSKNVLIPVSCLQDGAGPSNTFLINTLFLGTIKLWVPKRNVSIGFDENGQTLMHYGDCAFRFIHFYYLVYISTSNMTRITFTT